MKIKVNGVRLFVDIDGAEWVPDGKIMRQRPTLLLLHGGPGMDHSSLKSGLSHLTDIAQLIFVDHRGNGRSDHDCADNWHLDQWADDIYQLCHVLGIEKPIVMGQSFGGMVAQAYATRYPNHPSKVIFSSTAAKCTLSRNLAVFERLGGKVALQAASEFYENPSPETLPAFVDKCMSLYNQTPGDKNSSARTIMNTDLLYHFFRGEYHTMNFLPSLNKVTCPVLVLGGEDDPTTPIEDQVDISAALPKHLVQFERFKNCGHGAFRDHPERTTEIIKSFITS